MFMMFIFSPNALQNLLSAAGFCSSETLHFLLTFLMIYSNAALKYNRDKASIRLGPSVIWTVLK